MEHGTATFAQGLISPAMIAAWTLVAVAFFALGTLVYVAIRSRTRPVDLEKAVQAFRSLDIEAFRNLLDSAEEAFLRENLSPKKFREINRPRPHVQAGRDRPAAGAQALDRAHHLGAVAEVGIDDEIPVPGHAQADVAVPATAQGVQDASCRVDRIGRQPER